MARLAKRGEIWMIDLGMAAKVRPCLILSVPFQDQERVEAAVCSWLGVPH